MALAEHIRRQTEWDAKKHELLARLARLYLKTGGQGPVWEKVETLVEEAVAELEREEV